MPFLAINEITITLETPYEVELANAFGNSTFMIGEVVIHNPTTGRYFATEEPF